LIKTEFICSRKWWRKEDIVKMDEINKIIDLNSFYIFDLANLKYVFFEDDNHNYRNLFNLYEASKGEKDSGERVHFTYRDLEGRLRYEEPMNEVLVEKNEEKEELAKPSVTNPSVTKSSAAESSFTGGDPISKLIKDRYRSEGRSKEFLGDKNEEKEGLSKPSVARSSVAKSSVTGGDPIRKLIKERYRSEGRSNKDITSRIDSSSIDNSVQKQKLYQTNPAGNIVADNFIADKFAAAYQGTMRDYSVQQQQQGDNLTAVITKILAGDYRGKIENQQQSDLKEDAQQGYIWLWKDRVDAVKVIIKSQMKEYLGMSREKKNLVQAILSEQPYLRKKRDKEYQELKNLFA